jgi:microcystin-dependent protein
MSGLDKIRSVSSEPVIAPTLQSENLYAQTVTATNLIVENSVTLPESYVPTSNILRWSRVAVGGETIISGKDLSNNPLIYEPGYEQVYLNGSLLLRGIDYIATNGTTITGLGALLASDVIEVIAPSGVAVGDYYTQSQADAKFATTNQTSTPVASVLSYAAANAPSGWLLCDGRVYSFAAYPLLASLLLGTYGGNGTTTFAVPDLRGRTIAGPDNMGGTDAGRLDIANSSGTVTGAQYVSTSNHAHLHVSPIGLNSGTSMVINPGEGQLDLFGSYNIYDIQVGSAHYSGSGSGVPYERWYVTSSQSGAESLNKMQPTMILNYIIKAS